MTQRASEDAARTHLGRVVAEVWNEHKDDIELLAEAARRQGARDDWFWDEMVTSFCTNGGTANLAKKRARYGDALAWEKVCEMSDDQRAALFHDLPNPVRRSTLAPAIEMAFERIREAGGPAAMVAAYRACPTAAARIAFVQGFHQIGPKYARNIPMDVYDELVQDYYALDQRLLRILKALPGVPRTYEAREAYLREICRTAGLPNAWYLDRLLYNYTDKVEARLAALAADPRS